MNAALLLKSRTTLRSGDTVSRRRGTTLNYADQGRFRTGLNGWKISQSCSGQ